MIRESEAGPERLSAGNAEPSCKGLSLESKAAEPIIEPLLPIVDAHHHLWILSDQDLTAMEKAGSIVARGLSSTGRQRPRYLFDELLSDASTGHNIRASVFVEANIMYRPYGPCEMRSVGEVEFVNGMAAAAASGTFGPTKACAGIVGSVDLALGDAVEEVLGVHLRAGGTRYRGVRCPGVLYDEDPTILGSGVGIPGLLLSSQFRTGFKWLSRLGLSYDALVLEPQLPQLIDLARAFPATRIIVNHVGVPVGVGRYAGRREERFPIWRSHIKDLSRCENVVVKLGGLGVPLGGFKSCNSVPLATSTELSAEWSPYIETCIELFGVNRCMFESNFPVDAAACTYPTLWNAFKRITHGASQAEKAALYSGTAIRVYSLSV